MVESTSLLKMRTLTRTVGSNPTLTAIVESGGCCHKILNGVCVSIVEES